MTNQARMTNDEPDPCRRRRKESLFFLLEEFVKIDHPTWALATSVQHDCPVDRTWRAHGFPAETIRDSLRRRLQSLRFGSLSSFCISVQPPTSCTSFTNDTSVSTLTSNSSSSPSAWRSPTRTKNPLRPNASRAFSY